VNHFRSLTFLVLLIGCSVYSYWLSNKDFEWVVPYTEERSPAAVRESADFKEIIDKPLRVFKREALASSIEIISKDGKHHFSIGHYAVQGNKGPNFMCLEYPFIKLRLQGEGIAVSGKKAELVIVAPCRTGAKNKDMISPIEIPFDEMYRKPAQDQQFQFQQEKFTTEVHLKNVFGNWPKQWQLESIHFLRDTNDLETESSEKIDQKEIFSKNQEPLLIRAIQ
jgi:hypothetical protein